MGFISRGRATKTVYAGSACGGVDGATGRTLVHTKSMFSDSLVIVGRSTLILTTDYSVSGSTITFDNINIDNTDAIMIVS